MIRVTYIDDEANTEKMKSKFEVLQNFGIKISPIWDLSGIKIRIPDILKVTDIFIIDLIMPPKDEFKLNDTNGGSSTGLVLIQEIRKVDKKAPIIVVSIKQKKSINPDFFESYNIGGFLSKFCSASELSELINSIYKK